MALIMRKPQNQLTLNFYANKNWRIKTDTIIKNFAVLQIKYKRIKKFSMFDFK